MYRQKSFQLLFLTFISFFSSIIADQKKPRATIITSLFKGDAYIERFLKNVTQQSIFSECEFILINAASPGKEYRFIEPYLSLFNNITYIYLTKDPGIYAVWNYAIRLAQSDLLANANLDDLRSPDSLESQILYLEAHPEIDLVYLDYYVTTKKEASYTSFSPCLKAVVQEFSPAILNYCVAGPFPLWRKSLHERYGFFDETFKSIGDLEMWNRAALNGSVFKKIEGVSGLYYDNPEGLSTSQQQEKMSIRVQESQRIWDRYHTLWKL
jgi:hypothetical protein